MRSIDPTKNRNRLYELSIQGGILGTTVVITRTARYGKEGHTKIYIFGDEEKAKQFMDRKVRAKIKRNYFLVGS